MEKTSIYEKLLNIQTELKAPKGQYNSFGKFHLEDRRIVNKPKLS